MGETDDRARREAEQYDSGSLSRRKLDALLSRAADGPARLRLDQAVASVVGPYVQKKVLEIGSQGWTSVFIKNKLMPSDLTCINISQRELQASMLVARRLGVNIHFYKMDAHRLQFPNHTFDLIYGLAILHHLDLEQALREMWRVLSPGGHILFWEPLRLNPVARIIRLLTPRARTIDERPLGREELGMVRRFFHVECEFTELFHVGAAVISKPIFSNPVNPITRAADAIDRTILRIIPSMGPYYRSVLLKGRRRESPLSGQY